MPEKQKGTDTILTNSIVTYISFQFYTLTITNVLGLNSRKNSIY